MNTRPSRPSCHAAFTLIELLTVMAIISVLMGLLFTALNSSRDQARRAEAMSACRGIVNATKSYYNDYGKFPPVQQAVDGDPNTNGYYSYGDMQRGGVKMTNDNLFDILRAISRGVNNNHAMNTRQVKYFEMNIARDPQNPRSGFCDGAQFQTNQGQLMDPWGAPYCAVLDADGDDVIDMGQFYSDLAGANNIIRQSAVAFSMAKDNMRGAKGYEGRFRRAGSAEPPDDVATWQ